MLYEHSERFVNPLSHDEVVHGKGSLLSRMPGDEWQQMANLRVLLAYMLTRPGKKLLFMGTELAPPFEWTHERSLPWHLAEEPSRRGLHSLLHALGELYHRKACLWRADPDPWSFEWIDCSDRQQAVVSYVRRDGHEQLVVVLNLTPVPREGYRLGAPVHGAWHCVLSTDDPEHGGSGWHRFGRLVTQDIACHGHGQSLVLDLPPLSAVVLEPGA